MLSFFFAVSEGQYLLYVYVWHMLFGRFSWVVKSVVVSCRSVWIKKVWYSGCTVGVAGTCHILLWRRRVAGVDEMLGEGLHGRG